MPELPEVETIKRGLEKYLVGLTITDVVVSLPRIVRGDVSKAVGGKIVGVRRYGKGLVVDLDNGYSMAVHVKMTGQLVVSRQSSVVSSSGQEYPNKWTHVIFNLKNPTFVETSVGKQKAKIKNTSQNSKVQVRSEGRKDEFAYLYYSDVRQFGWVHVLRTEEVGELPFFKMIGPEPLKDLDLELFRTIVRNSQTSIKILLMDQRKIAGVGNIYANDGLFLAGVHPTRKASSLLDVEIEKLFWALEEVLQKSIDVGGASASNYVNVLGEKGGYQEHFLVYQKDGEKCMNCGETIERIVIGGRGTFVCEGCQK